MAERITGAMQTPDGYWRVETVRSGREQWFRIWHATTLAESKASIATVARILGDETLAALRPVDVENGAA